MIYTEQLSRVSAFKMVILIKLQYTFGKNGGHMDIFRLGLNMLFYHSINSKVILFIIIVCFIFIQICETQFHRFSNAFVKTFSFPQFLS